MYYFKLSIAFRDANSDSPSRLRKKYQHPSYNIRIHTHKRIAAKTLVCFFVCLGFILNPKQTYTPGSEKYIPLKMS